MSDYRKLVGEHLRITILRLLADDANYALNESILLDLVDAYGFSPSRDNLAGHLAWLEEQGLITMDGPEHCQVATLTRRGDDVAHARATVPGVKKPRPGEVK